MEQVVVARYVTIRLTAAQAAAAINACDLIRDQLEADGGDRRESAQYLRAGVAIEVGITESRIPSCGIRLSMGEVYGIIRCSRKSGHNGRCRPARACCERGER